MLCFFYILKVKEGGCKLQENVKSNSLWPTNSESKYVGRICSGFSNDGTRMLMTPLNAKCTPLTKVGMNCMMLPWVCRSHDLLVIHKFYCNNAIKYIRKFYLRILLSLQLLWTYTTQYHLLVKSMNLFDLKMSSSAQGHLCLKRDIF